MFIRAHCSFRPDCVWYHQSHFVNFYPLLFKIVHHGLVVLHSHELDSHDALRWIFQKASARIADYIVVPEINRGWILKMFAGSSADIVEIKNRNSTLGELPAVGSGEARRAFVGAGGSEVCSRFVIYQGAFMESRCLTEVVCAFRAVPFQDVGLILIGGDPDSAMFQQLRTTAMADKRVVVLARIEAPMHLAITAGCSAGLLLYRPGSLNSVYCAPNKLYEYAEFGLGMILPDFPALRSLNECYPIGELCDPEDEKSIASAMARVLSAGSDSFRRAAQRLLLGTTPASEGYGKILGRLEAALVRSRGGNGNG
jgi:glycosyltransferase involved in cell wall biosynthesis